MRQEGQRPAVMIGEDHAAGGGFGQRVCEARKKADRQFLNYFWAGREKPRWRPWIGVELLDWVAAVVG